MSINVGSIDRLVRILAGAAVLALAFLSGNPAFDNPVLFWGALAIGAILVLTGIVRVCPMYRILGVSTSKVLPND